MHVLARSNEDTRDPARAGRSLPARRSRGFSLVELLIGLTLLAILAGVVQAVYGPLRRLSLIRSADVAQAALARARMLAVARREVIRVELGPPGQLRVLDSRGSLLSSTRLQGDGFLRLDSLRLRPPVLRFNPKGQGSPGSLYLFKDRRAIRIISNFVGRLRRQAFSF